IGNDKAGFPNGRRLGDDVVDIALQVLEGELKGSANDLGDGVDANDVKFESSFPYVALPHSGSGTTAKTKQKVAGAEVLGAQAENNARTAPQGAVAAGAGGIAGEGSGAPVGAIALTLLLAAALGGGAWVTLRHAGSIR
ncbi:MAG: DUF4331 family protein, partial [Actinomycetota bacterium]